MKRKSLKNSLKYYDPSLTGPVSKAKQEISDLLDEDLKTLKSRYLSLLKKKKEAGDSKTA